MLLFKEYDTRSYLAADHIHQQEAVASGSVHNHLVDLAAAHNLASVAAAAGHNHQVVVAAVKAAAAVVVAAADRSLAFVTGLDKHQAVDLHQLQVSHTRDSVSSDSLEIAHIVHTNCLNKVTRWQLLVPALSALQNAPF